MQTLFVYYKLPVQEHAVWRPKVEAFQLALQKAWPGLTASLMQRPEATPEGIETWMEIYSHATQAFITALEKAAEQAELQRYIDGARHVETFVDLATCA